MLALHAKQNKHMHKPHLQNKSIIKEGKWKTPIYTPSTYVFATNPRWRAYQVSAHAAEN